MTNPTTTREMTPIRSRARIEIIVVSGPRRAEDVTDAAHGLDQRRLEGVGLAGEVADVRLQHARVAAEVVVPDVVEDLAAREHTTRVDQEIPEQPVLGRGEL